MVNAGTYNHQAVEEKWQAYWKKSKLNITHIVDPQKPFYNLMMFPYPSAEGLHVGNMYAFTGSDIFGRFKRMQGYEVFEPIGLDGFGIHSENYALKVNRHPMDHAAITQENFYRQLQRIGAMYDWQRTVETYDPGYYRWTQWLFIQMFKHGLAYRDKAQVNWCPSCKTVLADEQVIDGMCERCGNIVEKRPLEQWFFKITAYAEKLLQNSFSLDWTEKVKVAQQKWIGKKEGINISYEVFQEKGSKKIGEVICFTTTPVNFAATFLVLAPEHPFITQALGVLNQEERTRITRYLESTHSKTQKERNSSGLKKSGEFLGVYARNHVTGEMMPVWVSDFVLMEFGTGAIQGCPAHDVRDFEFAQTFGLPIRRVVVGPNQDQSAVDTREKVIAAGDEGTMINSDFLNGLPFAEAMEKTKEHFVSKGWGKRVVTYHLRDWIISRQRYWGPPIPMIYCEHCAGKGKGERQEMPGWYAVPEKDLPVLLPRIEDYKPGDDGIAPLAKHKEFYDVACPGCGGNARRETDVSDTFLDSSWYFLRYPSVNHDGKLPWDPAITKRWLPVSMYTGGAEHSVLHLMYSRFVTMALHDWGYLDFDEPFPHFYAHGLVIKDGAKMSKSKGNVVNPDEYIKLYGSDALRLYLMFMGPFAEGGDFRDSAMEGMSRWVGRIWRMAGKKGKKTPRVEKALQKLIKKVTEDMEKRRYNTAIAAMMEFTNLVADEGGHLDPASLDAFTLLLAPLAPHLAEELWAGLGHTPSVHTQSWPSYDEEKTIEETVTVVIQINGKLRGKLVMAANQAQDKKIIEEAARKEEKIAAALAGKTVRKAIVVPGRLINFVI